MNPMANNLRRLGMIVLVFLLSACATPTGEGDSSSSTSTVPPGQIRPAEFAGSWYPQDPEELASTVDGLLTGVRPIDGAPLVLILPHAGYGLSGPVAATGFRQMEQGAYDVAVIIAADHQLPVSDPISVWAEGGFRTPLGVVPVDEELAQALVAADPLIIADPEPYQEEHAIEVQLPFLQQACPNCAILPVLMGSAEEEAVQALSDALLAVLPGRRAVVVISSDLSHFPSQEDALMVDGATLSAIETGDPAALQSTIEELMAAEVPNLATCACGRGPILVGMNVAPEMGANIISVLRYANSADAPQGDPSQVVGYGAVMFWRYELPQLTVAHQQELLTLARQTLEVYLSSGAIPPYESDDPVLARRSAAFVTIKVGGEVRGSMGHTWGDMPMYEAVQRMAVGAAMEDSRFPPLTLEELEEVNLEISILSPYWRIRDVEQIEVGFHGLIIVAGGQRGVLLPQVPVEEGWNRETFLEALCQKANLPAGCWQEEASLYAFTAIVFGEE